MLLVFVTCTVTLGSGVRTLGIPIIKVARPMTAVYGKKGAIVIKESFAAGPGLPILLIVDLRIATIITLAIALTTLVFVLLSPPRDSILFRAIVLSSSLEKADI